MFAYYLDEFVKENGIWLFKRRELRINWISILPVEKQ